MSDRLNRNRLRAVPDDAVANAIAYFKRRVLIMLVIHGIVVSASIVALVKLL